MTGDGIPAQPPIGSRRELEGSPLARMARVRQIEKRLGITLPSVTVYDDFETDYRNVEEYLIDSSAIPSQTKNARYFDRRK
jgi:hypothetical protein